MLTNKVFAKAHARTYIISVEQFKYSLQKVDSFISQLHALRNIAKEKSKQSKILLKEDNIRGINQKEVYYCIQAQDIRH